LVALPDDQEGRLRCYRNALRNWRFSGYVRFKPLTEEWLANELPSLDLQEIVWELYRHVEDGGEIDEQKERRPEYAHHEFHYDLRVKIGDRRISSRPFSKFSRIPTTRMTRRSWW
jgi:hypothetical protein